MRFATAGYPKRWRLASSTVCSAGALVLVGCGGGDASGEEMLARDVGASLAGETAEVEDALAAGDAAAAREEALDLRDRVEAAIEAGDVPKALQRPLLAAVNRLVQSIPRDEPAPEPQEDDEEDDEDEGKGKGKGKGDDKGNGDKEGATTTTDVTTLLDTVTDGSGDG